MTGWIGRVTGPIFVAAVCSLLIAGCGGGDSPRKTVPVTGTIKLDGKAIGGATITFLPVDPTKHDGAVGVSDATGAYKMVAGSAEGAMEGSYKVVFQYYVNMDGSPIVAKEGLDMEQLKMSGSAKSGLPDKYADPETSGQTFDVKAGSPMTKDWELTST